MSAYDREAEDLERQLEEGCISQAEYNEAMRDMERHYRDAAHKAADQAYRRELGYW